ncbi:FAD-dependent oxidoreductase [Alkalicaulis satelles]|uniref:FAD-dependent oxidoreductase n=1 Tax=Alkalicaulis satelles TaxID=2609175 RepID=UPI001E59D164|nr:FAD-dependent oxidoreductase [Alkalicaulis satelles]
MTVRNLVLAGGGHAHAVLLSRWRPRPGVQITLINPGQRAAYSGMLPGHVAGHYPLEALQIDLARLCRRAGARLIEGRVCGLDPDARNVQVMTAGGARTVTYDVLSLDVGGQGAVPPVTGAAHIIPARPLDALAARWALHLEQVRSGAVPPEVCITGAGAAGVELALAAAHRLARSGVRGPCVSLVEAGGEITPGLPARARRTLLRKLDAAGIKRVTGARLTGADAQGVTLADGQRLPASLIIAAAGVRAQDWLAGTGLALNDGFVAVNAHLESLSHRGVFACGDCAHLDHAPRPKAGVYAVRAAPVLAHNLIAALEERDMQVFTPQRSYLHLIALGDKRALAVRNGLSLSGRWVWRIKDAIDRRFMRQLSQ